MGELARRLQQVRDGDATAQEVADWMRTSRAPPPVEERSVLDALADSGRTFEPDSFDEVSRALHLGWISLDDYEVLAEAATAQAREEGDR